MVSIRTGAGQDVEECTNLLCYYRHGLDPLIATRLGISNSTDIQRRYCVLRAVNWKATSGIGDQDYENQFLTNLLAKAVPEYDFVRLPLSSHAYLISEDRMVEKFSLLDSEAQDAIIHSPSLDRARRCS